MWPQQTELFVVEWFPVPRTKRSWCDCYAWPGDSMSSHPAAVVCKQGGAKVEVVLFYAGSLLTSSAFCCPQLCGRGCDGPANFVCWVSRLSVLCCRCCSRWCWIIRDREQPSVPSIKTHSMCSLRRKLCLHCMSCISVLAFNQATSHSQC